MITKSKILAHLSTIVDTTIGEDIVSAGLVSSIIIRGNNVGFSIDVGNHHITDKEGLRKHCETVIRNIDGVENVTIVLTAENLGKKPIDPDKQLSQSKPSLPEKSPQPKITVDGVSHIIAVASGKGGVGKSTSTINIAAALMQLGHSVGIVDADIYGPSIPHMLSINTKPAIEGKKMLPLLAHNIQTISIGYLVDKDKAAIWRGPMISKTLYQLIYNTKWTNVDILLIDLPPGTGDIHLSLMEKYPLDGAILITTPQKVALLDVEKSLQSFKKLSIPLYGLIENMSYLEQSDGHKHYLFGKGHSEQFSQTHQLPLLASIPLLSDITESGEDGTPFVTRHPEHPITKQYHHIASQLIQQIQQ